MDNPPAPHEQRWTQQQRWDQEKDPNPRIRAARQRAGRICGGFSAIANWCNEVMTAHHERDWQTLGYPDWESYVRAEFTDAAGQLGPDLRDQVIGAMTESGMSTRAIATVLGVNQSTVARRAQVMHDASPGRTVTGTDGKTYPATRAQPPDEPRSITMQIEEPTCLPVVVRCPQLRRLEGWATAGLELGAEMSIDERNEMIKTLVHIDKQLRKMPVLELTEWADTGGEPPE
jgi:hypothetical protein